MKTLPLGIEFNHNRVRVALVTDDDQPKLMAVASREALDDPAHALGDAVAELNTSERRCVLGIAVPDGLLRTITLPSMPRRERLRAAMFEAGRFIDYPIAEAAVSIEASGGDSRWTVGIARRAALAERVAAAKRAKLVAIAVDDVAFALGRVWPDVDGTIDIDDERTTVTVFAQPIPFIVAIDIGGDALTEAIALSLGIDTRAAAERIRSIGFGGAAEAQRDVLVERIAEALRNARASTQRDAVRIVLTGSASRIPGFCDVLARILGADVQPALLEPLASDIVPADVLRAAAPDWAIAYGLALWERAL